MVMIQKLEKYLIIAGNLIKISSLHNSKEDILNNNNEKVNYIIKVKQLDL